MLRRWDKIIVQSAAESGHGNDEQEMAGASREQDIPTSFPKGIYPRDVIPRVSSAVFCDFNFPCPHLLLQLTARGDSNDASTRLFLFSILGSRHKHSLQTATVFAKRVLSVGTG